MNLQFAAPDDSETVAETVEVVTDEAEEAMTAGAETDAVGMIADPVETEVDGRILLNVKAEEVQRAADTEAVMNAEFLKSAVKRLLHVGSAAALPTVFPRKSVNEIICSTNTL